MADDLESKHLKLPKRLVALIDAEAARQRRSFTQQITHDLEQRYADKLPRNGGKKKSRGK